MDKLFYPVSKILNVKRTINPYLGRLTDGFPDRFIEEEKALALKGTWREQVFKASPDSPLDLEIGTGNGFFFAHQCFQNPKRNLIGFEIKYRPLFQTMQRAKSLACRNGAGVRIDASRIDDIFKAEEINNTYIFFPDPWTKRKHHKNRLIQLDFLHSLYDIQKKDHFVEFKTDNLDYFEWTLEKFKKSKYQIARLTYDLHSSEWASENFVTHFEKLWTSKGLKTMLLRAYK